MPQTTEQVTPDHRTNLEQLKAKFPICTESQDSLSYNCPTWRIPQEKLKNSSPNSLSHPPHARLGLGKENLKPTYTEQFEIKSLFTGFKQGRQYGY